MTATALGVVSFRAGPPCVPGRCEHGEPVADEAGGGAGRVHCSRAAGSFPLVHRPGKERPGLCSDSTDGGPMRVLSGAPMASSSLPS